MQGLADQQSGATRPPCPVALEDFCKPLLRDCSRGLRSNQPHLLRHSSAQAKASQKQASRRRDVSPGGAVRRQPPPGAGAWFCWSRSCSPRCYCLSPVDTVQLSTSSRRHPYSFSCKWPSSMSRSSCLENSCEWRASPQRHWCTLGEGADGAMAGPRANHLAVLRPAPAHHSAQPSIAAAALFIAPLPLPGPHVHGEADDVVEAAVDAAHERPCQALDRVRACLAERLACAARVREQAQRGGVVSRR